MAIVLWVIVHGLSAAGAALLTGFIMRCRMDEVVAREKGALAELRSALAMQRQTFDDALSEARAAAKRAAFNDFLDDFRVEQQKYVHRSRLFFLTRQTLVVRERILFRNFPLSNWVEHRVTLEESVGLPIEAPIEAILSS
jgi:hypothetical protein